MSSSTIVSTTAPSCSSLLKWVRDSEFWFSDGDIVLAVKSSTAAQTVHLFRVHSPLLTLHSPVLLKKISDNTNQKPGYSGERMLWVPETNSKILEYFLRSLYNPCTDVPTRTLNDTGLCDGFLKLCKELGARSICTPMVKRLYNIWPPTLSAWDSTDAYIFASAQEYPRMGENSHGMTMRLFHDDAFPEPVSAICLGRLYDILNILPAALYHLSRIDPSSDYDKMHMEPTRSDTDSQQRLNAGLRSARWAFLTIKDHYALAGFKDYVQHCLTKLMAESTPHLTCQSGMEKAYLDIVRSSMATRDVLRELKSGFDEPRHICGSCIMHGKRVTSSMRMDIWAQLGVVLGLQSRSIP